MLLERVACTLLETAGKELDSDIVNLGCDRDSLIWLFQQIKNQLAQAH